MERSNTTKGIFALAALALLLYGCAHLGAGGYTVSESQVQEHLVRALQGQERLGVSLRDVRVELGPDGRDVALLDVTGEMSPEGLLARAPVMVRLRVEGSPVYVGAERAVYLRGLQVLEGRVESPWYTGELAPATHGMLGVLTRILDEVPIYRLDETQPVQRALGALPLDMRVGPGRLELVPAP